MSTPPAVDVETPDRPAGGRRFGFGPGAIFALAVIGAGDYVSNTAIGAVYGTSLLWTLLAAAVCRYVWVECCARYVLVTGETPFAGFARVSRTLVWVVLFTLIAHRHIHGLGHVVYLGASLDLIAPLPFAASSTVWSLASVAGGFVMIFWSGYRTIETVFKALMAFMGVSLVVVVWLSCPPPGDILRGLLVPSLPALAGPYSAVLLLTAMLGTEACSLSNLTYSYFMWQNGWRDLSYSARQRRDLAYGIAAMLVAGALLQIAAAGTLGKSGAPATVSDLVRVFSDRLGMVGRLAFALGIWAAVFTSFVGGIRGYSMAVVDIARTFGLYRRRAGGAALGDARQDGLARALAVFFCFSPLYILYTEVKPVPLILIGSSASVVVIPLISFVLLRLTSDRRIMGEHRNHWFSNLILAFVGCVACYFIYANAAELWSRFFAAARH